MTDEELKKVREMITFLQRYFGGTHWNIVLGPVSLYDKKVFRPLQEIRINGLLVNKDLEPVSTND